MCVLLLIAVGLFINYMHTHLASGSKSERVENTPSDAVVVPASDSKFERPWNTPSDEVVVLLSSRPVLKKIMVKTTAYSNDPFSINVPRWRDGRTATNTLARRGIVAADWDVFPPGTRIYIPGYGEAVVEDKGGAVNGFHLDLFLNTRREALLWGVKQIEVYVLEFGSSTAKEHQPSRKPNLAAAFPLG